MTNSSVLPPQPDFAAGGGLLSRRMLLRGAAAGSAAGFANLAMPERARAEAEIPEWVRVAGARARGYGMPAEQEADVQRAIIEPFGELAQAFSFSGTPHHRLRGTITPSGLHFEVHHGGRPDLDPARHRLMIHGMVDRPIRLDLDALERYPMVSAVHFLECSGNSFFNAVMPEPMQAGCDMLHGLLSNSEWTGVPVRILLEEAGIRPEGRWVLAVGNDAPSLARSIPVEKLMDDAFIALYQNGERIRPEQGYPMRLLLPGFEGNMNVKWITSLWVTDAPAHTKDESGEYTEILADGSSVKFTFAMGVKSLVTHPSATMTMSGPGFYEISGIAWSGAGPIRKVEISADGGASWAEAELSGPVHPRALTRFRLPWQWEGAPALLMSRAEDATGAVQPTRSTWKAKYDPSNFLHYNAIQPWQVTPEGMVQNVYA
ncbi:sulfite dehydrogenase [Limibaculum sp. M0105]|uniref:Sulfite dehydrogenase n=1 Tax=Thermohalobaculum xanthum TaxID=2753746 RepID=A0A8J7M3T4_9RHOB|nr:sulfite dehydrogenase [Thermohalobaculum xanthum]MBK0397688.1 sulfite dehydrogenase [Thermohalobaculum xanthum]